MGMTLDELRAYLKTSVLKPPRVENIWLDTPMVCPHHGALDPEDLILRTAGPRGDPYLYCHQCVRDWSYWLVMLKNLGRVRSHPSPNGTRKPHYGQLSGDYVQWLEEFRTNGKFYSDEQLQYDLDRWARTHHVMGYRVSEPPFSMPGITDVLFLRQTVLTRRLVDAIDQAPELTPRQEAKERKDAALRAETKRIRERRLRRESARGSTGSGDRARVRRVALSLREYLERWG